MWFEFFKFDLRYQLQQPVLWGTAFIYCLMSFAANASDFFVGFVNLYRNSPLVIVVLLSFFSLISLFTSTISIAGTVLRDIEFGMADMLFAAPIRKQDYLLGRFAASFVICLAVFALLTIAMILGTHMPWIDATHIGPFSFKPYIWAFFVIALPNLFFIHALLIFLASVTRSIEMVYVGVLAFIVLWVISVLATVGLEYRWLCVVTDPFGGAAFSEVTRYFSVNEANSLLPPLSSYLLANRVFIVGIGVLLIGATLWLFKPYRAATDARKIIWPRKTVLKKIEAGKPSAAWQFTPTFVKSGVVLHVRQCWQIFLFNAKGIFISLPFFMMLTLALLNFIGTASFAGSLFGTPVYPVTRLMLENLQAAFNVILIVIVTFYSGELIFQERQVNMADMIDTMPVPNWVPLLAKSLVICSVVFLFLFVGTLAGMVMQSYKDTAGVSWLPYLKSIAMTAPPFLLFGLAALALQVICNNKFIGYLSILLLFLSQKIFPALHFEHNMFIFASLPAAPYSDMNSFGHFWQGRLWYALYWAWFGLALLVVAYAFYNRNSMYSNQHGQRIRIALQVLRKKYARLLTFFGLGLLATGVWIFYNTNMLNQYQASDTALDWQAEYEKRYQQYQDLPHPKVIGVVADVDIFPAQRRIKIKGRYVLQNKLVVPLDTLRIQIRSNPNVQTTWENLPPHQLVLADKKYGFSIIRLTQAIEPGARIELGFSVNVHNPGFTNSGAANSINLNGSFFNNIEFFPQFAYRKQFEITEPHARQERGLGKPQGIPKLENENGRTRHMIGGEADWIDFETTVSTSADQIAVAPGNLQNSWRHLGRNYFHYKMASPMLPFFAYLSAQWEVKKVQWKGVSIEIYYDKKHAYNIDRFILASQQALDYYSAQFSPYPHRQLRIIEFPAYQAFAQSFPNTVPFSEALGFIADLRDSNAFDYVSFVTVHEIAHQWWGHQVIGANVQGAGMLTESLAQYSALMVMEKAYGRSQIQRFLRYEMDRYLAGRGTENGAEPALFKVDGQQYIQYNKASLIFYRLRDEIGEEALNRALKNFLQDKTFQGPPYTTSRELLAYIRAETPAEKQTLITDMFEKVIIYNNRVISAFAKPLPKGKWEVTMQFHQAKFEVDGYGQESPRKFDEPVEIAVFARPTGGKESSERVLLIEKRLLAGAEPIITVLVNEKPFEVGIDPYNKMIDRVAKDNRKQVVFEK